MPAERPLMAAALLRRDDGRVLLVRHADESRGGAGTRWTLPAEPVADDETAEAALVRLLRDRLRLRATSIEFEDSLGLPTAMANIFSCDGWTGEPAYDAADFQDAAWAVPGSPGKIDLVASVREWLGEHLAAPSKGGKGGAHATPEAVVQGLDEARSALLEAYGQLAPEWRDVSLDGTWAPVDVVAHCASVEAYYAAEARRLLEEPGHTWRPWNADQAEAERACRQRPEDRAERTRLEAVRRETETWLETLTDDDLAAFGNHAERGAVRVGERIAKIASHDRQHAAQLAAMLTTSQADDDQAVTDTDEEA